MRFKEIKKLIAKALVLTLVFSMLFTQNSYSLSDISLDQLPNPILELESMEVKDGYFHYELNVPNRNLFPDELFEPAPDLSPAGSRTWVEIMDGESDQYIYGFIAFDKADYLNFIWFSSSVFIKPHKSVYIQLNDRRANKLYKSNVIQLPQPSLQNLLFNSKASYPVGKSPFDLVPGDFNGDNKTDIVVGGKDSRNLMFLAGKGDGKFNDATLILNTPDNYPNSLATGDFNNDYKLDLIFSTEKNIYIALGKGNGTFSAAKSVYYSNTVVSRIKVFEFNKDRNGDLLLVNSVENSVSILTGVGDGTFKFSKSFSVGHYPMDAEIGDLDGDKIPDIITANSNSGNLSFLKGSGNGEFQDAVNFGELPYIKLLEIGDFNKDGIMDVAGIRSSYLHIVLGSKTSFGSKIETYSLSESLSGITTSDFNLDGNSDIAVVRYDKDICVLRGNGDGTFQVSGEDYYPSFHMASGFMISGDFNKDSKPDLAFINKSTNTVIAFINSYIKSVSTATVTSKPTSIPTSTPTNVPTSTPTSTTKATSTATSTVTPTTIATNVPTSTPTPTTKATSTVTSTQTTKVTSTATPEVTTTATKSTSTATPSATKTSSTSTAVPTNTPVKTDTQPVTNGASAGGVISVASPTGTSTSTPTPTVTSTPAVTSTPTATPTKASPSTQVATIKPTTVPVEQPSNNLPGSGVLKDIQKHWAKDKIEELIKQKIVSGYLDGTFKPDGEITRAEIAVVISKALKLEPSKGKTKFKDDKDIPSWAKPYIKSASENGIINGYGDGTFKPSRSSTREEFVVVLMRAFKFGESNTVLNLKDASEVKPWSKGYVAKAIEIGIVKGYQDNTFRPINKVTRAEAVVMTINAQRAK